MKVAELKIEEIKIPQGLLPRIITGTISEVVEKYARQIEEGVEFEPIVVWKRGEEYWLVDGAHRLEAHRKVGKEKIKAVIREDINDEIEYRIEAIRYNLKHGVALKPEERIQNAQILYRLGVSEEKLKEIFGVSERTIKRWLSPVKEEEKQKKKEEVKKLKKEGASVKEIAQKVGVSERTVYEWTKETAKNDIVSIFADEPTKEGLVLLSEFIEEKVESVENLVASEFERYLSERGKRAKGEEIFKLLQAFNTQVRRYIEEKVFEGYSESQIRALISRERKGILGGISSTARSKIAGIFSEVIREKIEAYERKREEIRKLVEKAKEIVSRPDFVFSTWENLARKVKEEEETGGLYGEHYLSKILLKHSEEILKEYYKIPQASEDLIKKVIEFYDIEEFEDLEQLIATVSANVIQEGYRPVKVRQIATEVWKKYQEEKIEKRKYQEELENAKEKLRELLFYLVDRLGLEETKTFIVQVLKEARQKGIIRTL